MGLKMLRQGSTAERLSTRPEAQGSEPVSYTKDGAYVPRHQVQWREALVAGHMDLRTLQSRTAWGRSPLTVDFL